MLAKDYFEKEYDKNHIKEVVEMNDLVSLYGLMDEFKQNTLKTINKRLDIWIKSCENNAEMFEKQKLETAKFCSESMALAYKNVKELFETI